VKNDTKEVVPVVGVRAVLLWDAGAVDAVAYEHAVKQRRDIDKAMAELLESPSRDIKES